MLISNQPGLPGLHCVLLKRRKALNMAPDLHHSRSDHWEAMLLAWKSLHVPVGTILLVALLVSGAFSAISMVWGYGPVNPVP